MSGFGPNFGPLTAYTPSAATQTGTITTIATTSGAYRQLGKLVFFRARVDITTNGTGAGYVTLTLPVAALGVVTQLVGGREIALAAGKALVGQIAAGATTVIIVDYAGAYPGANGSSLEVCGWYEAA